MNTSLTIAMLVAAGAVLVAQNLLMVRITASVSTVIVTLVINSGVGLALLLTTLLLRNGMEGLTEACRAFRPWFLLPGLLGSFFVFAGILGYQRVGAAATVSVLVASQLVTGLIVDAMRANEPLIRVSPMSVVGTMLLMAGVVLIVRERM